MIRYFFFILLGLAIVTVIPTSGITSEFSTLKKIRQPAVDGSWYPKDSKKLANYLTELFQQKTVNSFPKNPSPIRALIVPHAGYVFSGATAAAAFKPLMGKHYQRVVVLGPAHRKRFLGLSIPDFTHYKTPLGEIPLDLEAIQGVLHQPDIHSITDAHTQEHSIEMTLPLLQTALAPGWKLIPILVGSVDQENFSQVAQHIKPLLDEKTLLVVSGDFTHYGPNYGFMPFPNDQLTADNINKLDQGALEKIFARDAEGFIEYRTKTGITACAFGPITLLLHLLPTETQFHLIHYQTSGTLTGDYTNSVSYVSVVITSDDPIHNNTTDSTLSSQEMILLHEMARRALDVATLGSTAIQTEKIANEFLLSERFQKPSGAFVTLKKHGYLRGCIGFIEPIKPLYQAIIENAVNAALRDHRFRAVKHQELADLEVEISVLSPMVEVDSYKDFKVGYHGIVLSKQGRKAVFLPEVAVEQKWNREQTLEALSQKAGLPKDAWKKGTLFKVFTSQVYSAPFNKLKPGITTH